jgi:hypothetical protein
MDFMRAQVLFQPVAIGHAAAQVEGSGMSKTFMFATGAENSNLRINGGRTRVDELKSCPHDKHWRTDFALLQVAALNVPADACGGPAQAAAWS